MRRFPAALVLASLVFAAPSHAAEPVPSESQTVFHFAEKAWAVGTIVLGQPLKFREGKVLAFPTQITELTWTPKDTKPRNLMLIHELSSAEAEQPFFNAGDQIFAPIRLLPQHSYWRDNLPTTPRHQIAGGRRNAFRGDDLPEAKRILGAYLTAMKIPSIERWKPQVAAVASALVSTAPVLREDAVRFFATHATLARDLDQTALPHVQQFLAGTAPEADKATVIDALAAGNVTLAKPAIQELTGREDATGAAALRAMARFGDTPDLATLLARSRSASPEVRAWSAGMLGRQAATQEAYARAVELLEDDSQPMPVRDGAARGLAESRQDKAQAALIKAVERGDGASQPSADALAASGAVSAAPALIDILEKKDGKAAYAAAYGLSRMQGCGECATALRKQHEGHRDESVRHLIGVILEVPMKHEH